MYVSCGVFKFEDPCLRELEKFVGEGILELLPGWSLCMRYGHRYM